MYFSACQNHFEAGSFAMPFFLSTRFFVSDLHNFSPSGIEYVSILLTGYSYSIKFPRLHTWFFLCNLDRNTDFFELLYYTLSPLSVYAPAFLYKMYILVRKLYYFSFFAQNLYYFVVSLYYFAHAADMYKRMIRIDLMQ